MPLSLLFRSQDLLVIDKPTGVSVHNAGPNEIDVLGLVRNELGFKEIFPVHRLDKETSGIQVLALDERAARMWAERFQSREVQKIYRAVVRGRLENMNGVWNKPLTDKAEGRSNPQGLSQKRVPCETQYEVLKQNRYFSLLHIDLKTGRQHQIRKHAALDRHALIGDSRYGDKSYNLKIAKLYGTERLFLHCHRISYENFNWESPLPPDFLKLVSEADTEG